MDATILDKRVMEFNKLVIDRFNLIFQKNIHVIEQFRNYVKIKLDDVVITVSRDEREGSNSIYIGRKESSLYPLNENVLKDVFNSALKIDYVTPEVFVNNLVTFFAAEGNALIAGNPDALKKVEKYVDKVSNEYTKELIDNQNLAAANKAWEEGNYKDFIKYLDRTDRQKLPSSYELKYKIAHQKLK